MLQHPKYTEKLCQALAANFAQDQVQLVVGPVTGGILLAHEVGKALGTRAIFTERENGKMTLKRGFEIPAGTKVLVVEDIVTTGGSVFEVLDVIKEHGGSSLYIPSYKTTFRNNENCEEYKERLGEKRLVKKLSKKYELSEAQILLITKPLREPTLF